MRNLRLLCPWNTRGKNTGVGSHSLFRGIFPTQGLNPGLLYCRQVLYHVSHQGNLKNIYCCCCCSVAKLCQLCNPVNGSLPGFPVLSSWVWANSCLLSWWCHPTILSSVAPLSYYPQSFLPSGSFPVNQLFASGGESIGASASASVLPMNIQDWFSVRLTGLISLQSKGLSRVFSNTTVQKHQFFSARLSLWPDSDIHTWLLEKP